MLKTFMKLPGKEKAIVVEAAFLLLASRLIIILLPYRMFKPLLGKYGLEAVNEDFDLKTVQRIAFWIQRVASKMPIKCNCLPQAITGRLMLKRRGIQSMLYLGVGKNEVGKLEARLKKPLLGHAWVMVNDFPVTGGRNNDHLTKVARFG